MPPIVANYADAIAADGAAVFRSRWHLHTHKMNKK